MQNKAEYPTFTEFMRYANHDEWLARLLVQAIAKLSVTDEYSHMEPEEIYNKVVETAKAVHETPPV